MSTEIQFDIDGFYDYVDDINCIQSVDDILEYLREYLDSVDIDRDFNVHNIIDLDIDENLSAAYYDDEAMDLKIETINNIIRLLLTDDL